MPQETLLALVVFVLWTGFCLWAWRGMARSKQMLVIESWSPFAQRTGRTDSPRSGPSLMGTWDEQNTPRGTGEYRGYPVNLRLASLWIDVYDGSMPVAPASRLHRAYPLHD
jgi:hypothetical protein